MLYAHLDADCFYVSAERVRDTFLVGKPVGVLGNQGACVIAKSYEAKAAGIKTGEPIWEAREKCPEMVAVKRDFRWYEVLSRAMLDRVKARSPTVEYYSIDEFFLSVDSREPQRFAEDIRADILDRVRIPVTVGVARTRTLAKLVSDHAKPFGALALIGEEAERALLASLPASEVTGIAARSAAKLTLHGIRTALDVANARPSLIRKLLTVTGERLCFELRGEPCVPIQTNRPPHKIISRGGSIGQATADESIQWAWVIRNLERLIEAMKFHGLQAGRLGLILIYREAPTWSGEASPGAPTDRFDLLLEAVRSLWAARIAYGPLQGMHLLASRLQYPGPRQLSLFDPPTPRTESVEAIKRIVADRHGRFALRSASTLPLAELYVDEAHDYEVCDIHGKTCF